MGGSGIFYRDAAKTIRPVLYELSVLMIRPLACKTNVSLRRKNPGDVNT